MVSARFARQAWAGQSDFAAALFANHSGLKPLAGATLTAEVRDAHGQVAARLEDTVTLAANAATPLGEVRAGLAALATDVFALDLSLQADGRTVAANRYLFSRSENLRPLLDLEATTLAVDTAREGERWAVTVRNTGAVAALGVWLEDPRPHPATGYMYFDDNHFSLFPGEARVLGVEWDNVPAGERQLSVAGWNTPQLSLTP
jgi:beta-mannosidase